MAWYCAQCGKENLEDAAYCTECGAAREWIAVTGKKSAKKPLLIGGILLGLVLAGLGLCLLLGVFSPKQFRMTSARYSRYEAESGRTMVTSEVSYIYNKNGTGQAIHTGDSGNFIEELTLDKRGRPVSSVANRGGEVLWREEYEYDKYGNKSLVRRFDETGALVRQWEYTYNPYRVVEKMIMREYENGVEVYRQEFVSTDLAHVVSRVYRDGVLSSTVNYLRTFEGNKLVGQQTVQEDGTPGEMAIWERDKDYNVLSYMVPFSSGDRIIQTFTYERIR